LSKVQLIKTLKEKVVSARTRTMLAANAEQIKLYWEIGKTIVERQKHSSWGSKLLEQISTDLMSLFPGMKSFSRRNLFHMRQLAQIYPGDEFVKQAVSQLPWGHIILLIQKVKEEVAREWYAEQTIQQDWARDALARNIKMDLFARQGQLSHQAMEREIEKELVDHVRKFLLRMGTGFAFVGSQYHVDVGGDDFYIDLLLFNIKLNCYVVVELKKGKFKPEHSGKLNFYLSIVDDLIKEEHHSATLGLLLCESRNRVVAEYALERVESPMGITRYELSKQIPEALRSVLPSVEILEEQLSEQLKEECLSE